MVTITYDHQARRRSYELLAEAFGLEPRAVTCASVLGRRADEAPGDRVADAAEREKPGHVEIRRRGRAGSAWALPVHAPVHLEPLAVRPLVRYPARA